jgi:hypothetical protein
MSARWAHRTGFRIMFQQDEDFDSTLENSERYYALFDERWLQVATFRDQDEDPKARSPSLF